jgi:hypothetical protein
MPWIVYGYRREFPYHPNPKIRHRLQAQGKQPVLEQEAHVETTADLQKAQADMRREGLQVEVEKVSWNDWPVHPDDVERRDWPQGLADDSSEWE